MNPPALAARASRGEGGRQLAAWLIADISLLVVHACPPLDASRHLALVPVRLGDRGSLPVV
jgi:hypothetical protein